jgi:hypothetical protein
MRNGRSRTRLGGFRQDGRGVFDGVKPAGRDLHDEVIGVVGQGQAASVDAVEGDQGSQREPLQGLGVAGQFLVEDSIEQLGSAAC